MWPVSTALMFTFPQLLETNMANLSQLASDLNNPDYVNPTNPDAVLQVRFYNHQRQNRFQTESTGKPVFEDVVYVEIITPGDNLNIINVPARDVHKQRFPRQWAQFQKSNGSDNEIAGIPLSQWPVLKPASVTMLKAINFHTVESIAFASDAQLQSIGMSGGMEPITLRAKAKQYLSAIRDTEFAEQALKESQAREQEIRELRERDAQREKEMQEMRDMLASMKKTETLHVPKK